VEKVGFSSPGFNRAQMIIYRCSHYGTIFKQCKFDVLLCDFFALKS